MRAQSEISARSEDSQEWLSYEIFVADVATRAALSILPHP